MMNLTPSPPIENISWAELRAAESYTTVSAVTQLAYLNPSKDAVLEMLPVLRVLNASCPAKQPELSCLQLRAISLQKFCVRQLILQQTDG